MISKEHNDYIMTASLPLKNNHSNEKIYLDITCHPQHAHLYRM